VSRRHRAVVLPRSGAAVTFGCLAFVLVIVVLLGLSPNLNPVALLTGRGFDVEVPDVIGLTQTKALLDLEANRLEGLVRFGYSSTVPRGIVVAQSPRSGGTLRRGEQARLVVSRGPSRVVVPQVTGENEAQARRDLARVGLRVKIDRLNSETVDKDKVVRQNPQSGSVISGGDAVALSISLGPVARIVPNVGGIALEGGLFNIGRAGLALGTTTQADDASVPAGAIVSTDPPAGATVARDAPINVTVSNGPPPVPAPQLVGGTLPNASSQLAALGLVAGEVSSFGDTTSQPDGTIISQDPAPGTMVRAGQVVTLTVRRAVPTTTTTTAAPPPGG